MYRRHKNNLHSQIEIRIYQLFVEGRIEISNLGLHGQNIMIHN